MDIKIELPFQIGEQVFLLKEAKRGEKSSFSFEAYTCSEFRIIQNAEGTEAKVKFDGVKPLYNLNDCFTSLADIQTEINNRTGVNNNTTVVNEEETVTEEG